MAGGYTVAELFLDLCRQKDTVTAAPVGTEKKVWCGSGHESEAREHEPCE